MEVRTGRRTTRGVRVEGAVLEEAQISYLIPTFPPIQFTQEQQVCHPQGAEEMRHWKGKVRQALVGQTSIHCPFSAQSNWRPEDPYSAGSGWR